MELTIEIKVWPKPVEPMLADIVDLYTGPHKGDVLLDENSATWVCRDDVSVVEARARGLLPGVIGDYQYNSRLRKHIVTITDQKSLRQYAEWERGCFSEKI
jgi:hypothetical protein